MFQLPESTSDETEERTDWEAELVSAGMELADAHFEARQGITADKYVILVFLSKLVLDLLARLSISYKS